MIGLLINLIILACICGVAWWILMQIPLPAPFNMIVRVVFGLIVLLVLLDMASGFGGLGWRPWWRGY